MAIPDEVFVNGRWYALEETGESGGDIVLGCVRYAEGRILLNMDVDLECQLKSIWHEACHIAQQDLEGEMSEKLANFVSTFAHNFLCHNQEIAKCYTPEEGDDATED